MANKFITNKNSIWKQEGSFKVQHGASNNEVQGLLRKKATHHPQDIGVVIGTLPVLTSRYGIAQDIGNLRDEEIRTQLSQVQVVCCMFYVVFCELLHDRHSD